VDYIHPAAFKFLRKISFNLLNSAVSTSVIPGASFNGSKISFELVHVNLVAIWNYNAPNFSSIMLTFAPEAF